MTGSSLGKKPLRHPPEETLSPSTCEPLQSSPFSRLSERIEDQESNLMMQGRGKKYQIPTGMCVARKGQGRELLVAGTAEESNFA